MDNQTDNYDETAPSFAMREVGPTTWSGRLGYVPAVQALNLRPGQTVLDFGCGAGVLEPLLTAEGAKVIGLDQSAKMIELARQHHPNGQYHQTQGRLVDQLAGQTIDAAIGAFVVCAMSDAKALPILTDIGQLLGSGKLLVLLEPNQAMGEIDYGHLRYHKSKGLRSGDRMGVTLRFGSAIVELTNDVYRTHDDYRQLLEQAGFNVHLMMEPRPQADWEGNWKLEDEYPPHLIIVASVK